MGVPLLQVPGSFVDDMIGMFGDNPQNWCIFCCFVLQSSHLPFSPIPKGNGSSSNHAFSGALAASFREGNLP